MNLSENKNILQRLPIKDANPYYICAPAFIRTSGGIKLLYLLCHYLNICGYRAYIYCYQKNSYQEHSRNNLITPYLSYRQINKDIKLNYNPIVINSDTKNDILKLPCSFRYLLNYIGVFPGEPKSFDIEEKYYWAFSTDIAKKHNIPNERIFFLPVLNYDLFFSPSKKQIRQGKCCYLGKYAEFNKSIPKEVQSDEFTIFTRSLTKNKYIKQKDYADLMRKSEMIYIYENTGVMMEALLCECPVVLISTPYQSFSKTDTIGLKEIGINGIAFGESKEEIERAKRTVHLAKNKIQNLIDKFPEKLEYFINETQRIANEKPKYKPQVPTDIWGKKKKGKLSREIIRILNQLLKFIKLKIIFINLSREIIRILNQLLKFIKLKIIFINKVH
jgi:hypothetical protein